MGSLFKMAANWLQNRFITTMSCSILSYFWDQWFVSSMFWAAILKGKKCNLCDVNYIHICKSLSKLGKRQKVWMTSDVDQTKVKFTDKVCHVNSAAKENEKNYSTQQHRMYRSSVVLVSKSYKMSPLSPQVLLTQLYHLQPRILQPTVTWLWQLRAWLCQHQTFIILHYLTLLLN